MRNLITIVAIATCSLSVSSAAFTWTEQPDASLPKGVKVYRGSQSSPRVRAYYVDVDLEFAEVRAVKGNTASSVNNLAKWYAASVGINGGFFGGSVPYSAAMDRGKVLASNVNSVSRQGKTYPLMRGLFSTNSNHVPRVDWVYKTGSTINAFTSPIPYSYNDPTPKSPPSAASGEPLQVYSGIGGGPVLVKNGRSRITWNEEILWGSGVSLSNRDPRSAIGYTANNHVILFVCDGRQSHSVGMSLIEVANTMISLGAVGALNLDGGGSTQLAKASGQFINSPSDFRSMPTMLGVYPRTSGSVVGEPDITSSPTDEDGSNPGGDGGDPNNQAPATDHSIPIAISGVVVGIGGATIAYTVWKGKQGPVVYEGQQVATSYGAQQQFGNKYGVQQPGNNFGAQPHFGENRELTTML